MPRTTRIPVGKADGGDKSKDYKSLLILLHLISFRQREREGGGGWGGGVASREGDLVDLAVVNARGLREADSNVSTDLSRAERYDKNGNTFHSRGADRRKKDNKNAFQTGRWKKKRTTQIPSRQAEKNRTNTNLCKTRRLKRGARTTHSPGRCKRVHTNPSNTEGRKRTDCPY